MQGLEHTSSLGKLLNNMPHQAEIPEEHSKNTKRKKEEMQPRNQGTQHREAIKAIPRMVLKP